MTVKPTIPFQQRIRSIRHFFVAGIGAIGNSIKQHSERGPHAGDVTPYPLPYMDDLKSMKIATGRATAQSPSGH
jgi:hypothetical protein